MTADRRARLLSDKAMLRQTLDDSGLCLKEVASAMNLPYSYVAHTLNDEKAQPPTWDFVRLFMQATGRRRPLCSLASEFGSAVVALPTTTPGNDDIRDRFLVAVEELGQDSAVIQRALGDGEITPSEGRDIAAELRDTIDALLAVEAAVLARVERKTPAKMALPTVQADRRRA